MQMFKKIEFLKFFLTGSTTPPSLPQTGQSTHISIIIHAYNFFTEVRLYLDGSMLLIELLMDQCLLTAVSYLSTALWLEFTMEPICGIWLASAIGTSYTKFHTHWFHFVTLRHHRARTRY